MSEKKLAGLWLDGENAIIAKNHDGQETSEFTISPSVSSEKKYPNSSENTGNNAEQTIKRKYFKEIEKHLTNTQELYITGPGTIQEELKHYLEDTPQFKNLKITLDTAPSYQINNDNVLQAVKEHFNA